MCMRSHSILKYCSRDCSLEVAFSLCHVAIYKLVCIIQQQVRIIVPPCMECCGHAEIVYAFQWIEKKVKKGRIKESPWCSRKLSSEQQFVNPTGLPLLC